MAEAQDTEILSWRQIWRDGQGQAWLVVLDFARVAGRTECVGMQAALLC